MRKAILFSVLTLALGLAGCLVQFYAESDLAGLPCTNKGECETGYFCKNDVCIESETLQETDACDLEEECSEGLHCIDMYEACTESAINCYLNTNLGTGKRCRAGCEPGIGKDAEQCPSGQLCYNLLPGGELVVKGICQEGVCSEHSDCGTNAGLSNFCSTNLNGAGSGLCSLGCDPFQCNYATSCNDCPSFSQGCEPWSISDNSFYCIEPGQASAGEPCGAGINYCTTGAFCKQEAGNTSGVCRRYCAPGGGNPACATGESCFSLTTTVGYCAP